MYPWIVGGGVVLLSLLKSSRVLARGPGAGLVASGSVTSAFGPRQLPGEVQKMHQGIDVAAPLGAEVRAALSGQVVDISRDGERSGYGNVVILEHPGGVLTLYAHLQSFGPGIHLGKVVERGDVVGFVGATHAPSKTYMAPHLHFEVLKGKVLWNDKVVVNPTTPIRHDPKVWLKQRSVSVS